jgi:hypothetical protein
MLEQVDLYISSAAERFARTISRRRLLIAAVKGVVAATAAATLGTLTNVTVAFASCCGGNVGCAGIGTCTSSGGCPSACTTCLKSNHCGPNDSYCPHVTGQWTCSCGICGGGWTTCTDCKCPDCSTTCTCATACQCPRCCSPADVEAEMSRIAALRAAA